MKQKSLSCLRLLKEKVFCYGSNASATLETRRASQSVCLISPPQQEKLCHRTVALVCPETVSYTPENTHSLFTLHLCLWRRSLTVTEECLISFSGSRRLLLGSYCLGKGLLTAFYGTTTFQIVSTASDQRLYDLLMFCRLLSVPFIPNTSAINTLWAHRSRKQLQTNLISLLATAGTRRVQNICLRSLQSQIVC